METSAVHRGVARLMVRRHLSDLIRPDIGTEDQLTEMLVRCMAVQPDAPLKEVVRAFRMTVNQQMLRRDCRLPAATIRTIEE